MSPAGSGTGQICPQCSSAVPDPAPALCPQCHYPLLLAQPDQRHAGEAAALHRPSAPDEPDDADATRLVPVVDPVMPAPTPLPAEPVEPTIACPACAWPNPVDRERCERCAAVLRPAVPEPEPLPPPPPPRPSGVPWWLVATGLAAVVLLVVAVVIVVPRLGDLVGGEPPASTPPSAPPTTLTVIDPATIEAEASSVLPEDTEPYDPGRLLDGDPRTAWNSDGNTIGPDGHPTLTFTFADPVRIGRIDLLNGFQKDARVYGLNCRVKTIQVSAGEVTRSFELADSTDLQVLRYDSLVPVTKVVLTVGDVYPGSKFADIALSEVTFHALG